MMANASPDDGNSSESDVPDPLFSVIIPTFGRPERLRECLSALSRLDPGTGFEVVVVNDGSPMPIDHVIAEFDGTIPVRLVTQSRQGPGPARNAGAAVALRRWDDGGKVVGADAAPLERYWSLLDQVASRGRPSFFSSST